MAAFKAIVIEKAEAGQKVGLTDFDEADLMDGDVTVRVEWSTLNYKDGLAITGKAPVVRRFPMIPGSISRGPSKARPHPDWRGRRQGDPQRLGSAERPISVPTVRRRGVNGNWLVRLSSCHQPPREAMATAPPGLQSMLAVMALERLRPHPDELGPVVVTGAAGGVGSVAVAILPAAWAFQVIGIDRPAGRRPLPEKTWGATETHRPSRISRRTRKTAGKRAFCRAASTWSARPRWPMCSR